MANGGGIGGLISGLQLAADLVNTVSGLFSSTSSSQAPSGSGSRGNNYRGNSYKGNNYRGNSYKGNNYRANTYKGSNYRGNTYKGSNYRGNTYKGSNNRGNAYKSSNNRGNAYKGKNYRGNNYKGKNYNPRGGEMNQSGGMSGGIAKVSSVASGVATGLQLFNQATALYNMYDEMKTKSENKQTEPLLEIFDDFIRKGIDDYIFIESLEDWDEQYDKCDQFLSDARNVGFVSLETEFLNLSDPVKDANLLLLGNYLGLCLMVRISDGALPLELQDFLTDTQVYKCGVGMAKNVDRIENQVGIRPCSWVDLRFLDDRPPMSLKQMASTHLNIKSDTTEKLFDWKMDKYPIQQLISVARYANWSCRLLLYFVKKRPFKIDPSSEECLEEDIMKAVHQVVKDYNEKR